MNGGGPLPERFAEYIATLRDAGDNHSMAPHEVWNDSDRERIVLVVDLWHPDLTDDEVRLLDGFQRYVERAAKGLQGYWSANER